MDGFSRRMFENFLNDPDKSDEDKRALADALSQAYGPNPTPEQAEAVKSWCPMGDP